MLPYQSKKHKSGAIGIKDFWYLAGGISRPSVKGVYVPCGAADLEAGLVNKNNPGTDDLMKLDVDPGWDIEKGFLFDGISQRLRVGNILLDGASSVLMRVANVMAKDGHMMGCNDDVGIFSISKAREQLEFTNGTTIDTTWTADITGVAIAGTKAYRNGVALPGTFTPISAPLSTWCVVGGLNNNGSIESFDEFDLLWMAVYSGTLSAAQVAAVYGAAPV